MAYGVVENFAGGVDRSRPRYALPPGTLWSGINGHLSRGGDFEKRLAFVEYASLPAGTFGLAATVSGLVTFGSAAVPAGMPSTITYQRLQHPTVASASMAKLRARELFNGKLYAISEFDTGDIRHYYDATNITDWNGGANKPVGYGSIARTWGRKLYSPIGSIVWFSQTDTPTTFDTGSSGSGFQNMNSQNAGSDAVTAMAAYQQKLAIFARRVVMIWDMQTDPAQNAPVQTIPNLGTRAPRSCVSFFDLDTFFLSDTGIRSLRARQGISIAGVNDVGTPIDPELLAYLKSLTDSQVSGAIGEVEPGDGRFWLAVGQRIYVFSYFPSKKISAWSWYEPGFEVSDIAVLNGRIYCRAADKVYIYGGTDGETYDSCRVTCALPFIDGGKPGTYKQLTGIDIGATGEWAAKVLVNPNDENDFVDLGTISGCTFLDPNTAGVGHVTHMAPEFINEAAGPASISRFAIYNDAAETSV